MRGFHNWAYLFGGPSSKDYSLLGSILGSPLRHTEKDKAGMMREEGQMAKGLLKTRV